MAGQTGWSELAPGVAIRLVSAGTADAAGRALFALEIDMPEDTKTYWRIPGETGLPLELDFGAASGVALHAQYWPFPEREAKDGYLDYVYFGHTILPFALQIDEPSAVVDVRATLGICSDICMPAQVRLTLPALESERDGANALRIKQAMAAVPIAWETAPEPLGAASLLPDGSALAVGLNGDIVDPRSLIAATETGEPLFGAPQKSPQDNLVLLPILGKTDNSALDDMEVEFSFMTEMGAFAVSRTIEAGAETTADILDR